MPREDIPIIRIETGEAVKSIGELKENITALKARLNDLTIGTEPYKATLDELKVNQAALKDAMYATTSSLEDVTKAATGAGTSYNALVHRMAALKEEFRATNDEARRDDLAVQIKAVNSELKNLDEKIGNYQRNVGDYKESIKGAFKDLSSQTDSLDKSLKLAKGGLNNLKGGFEAFSHNPAVASFGLLVVAAQRLSEAIGENEDAMTSIKKAMASLKPVMDFLSGILDKVVMAVSDLAVKLFEYIGQSGILSKVVDGIMGIGNAILQFIIKPYQAVISAIEVFKDKGVKGFKEAGKAFAKTWGEAWEFKKNYNTGKRVAEDMAKGMKSAKKDVAEAAGELGDAIKDEVEGKLAKIDWNKLTAMDKTIEARMNLRKENDAFLKDLQDFDDAIIEEVEDFLAERDEAEKDAYIAHRKREEQRIADMYLSADATASVLSSIADMYDADEKASTKNAKKIKGLRIATSIIDTIAGAVKALSAKAEDPVAAFASAAAITAAGMANVMKIKATQIGSSETANNSASATALAPAPALQTSVTPVRSVTSATEETRLNQMASEQRVYILASDIEASQKAVKTRISQTSF